MASIKQLLPLTLTGLCAAHAVPAPGASLVERDYPEVIPGPGLPSLASLNLTSKMLYEMPLPADISAQSSSSANLEKRVVNSCDSPGYGDVADARACYNFLRNLGSTACRVGGGKENPSKMCTTGTNRIAIVGYSTTGNPESSSCFDTSAAVLWVIDHCTRGDQKTGGLSAPGGNGNIEIYTEVVGF